MTDDARTAPATDPAANVPVGRPPRPPRPAPRRVEVVSVSRLTPRLVSVRLGGPALAGFQVEAPTSHMKVFLPAPGQVAPTLPEAGPGGPVWPGDAPRPAVRTYTPRRWDEATGTLEVQFVIHGSGPASAWAEQATAGDQLAVRGPGGRFQVDATVEHWWIAGDESAVPAVATLLEALPPSSTAEVHLEAAGPDDEIPLLSPAHTTITWHHRRTPDAWGTELYEAAQNASIATGSRIWVACEAAAMRRIRTHLLADRQIPASSLVTRGYWRLGTANHPDHDYGDDTAQPLAR
jgi:NADPH-dependent ferric siderophore reductase